MSLVHITAPTSLEFSRTELISLRSTDHVAIAEWAGFIRALYR